jgi:hypothetical protein
VKLNISRTLFLILLMPALAAMIPYASPDQWTSSGIFTDPQPTCPPATCTGIGTDLFTWGEPVATSTVSSLGFRGRTVEAAIGQEFDIGELDYFNGTGVGGTGIDSVDLCLEVSTTDPQPQTASGCARITIVNSLNTSDPVESADRVTMRKGGVDFFVLEEEGASSTVRAKIRQAAPRPSDVSESEADLVLEIVGFGEITGGAGFLRSFVYVPIMQRGS